MVTGVTIDMAGINDLARQVRTVSTGVAGDNAFRRMLRQWGVRYLEFVRRRYLRLARSGGGGEWPPLSPHTIARRRKGRGSATRRDPTTGRVSTTGGASAAVLIDTGSLVAALNVGAPGNVFADVPGGIVVGFGPATHPHEAGKAASFATIAAFHNRGGQSRLGGRVVTIPARPILVAPDDATVSGMIADASRAMRRAIERAAAKAAAAAKKAGGGGG